MNNHEKEQLNALVSKIQLRLDELTVMQTARMLAYFNKKFNDILKIKYQANHSLTFQAREIDSIQCDFYNQHAEITLSVNIISVMGARGLLPSHYTLDLLAAKKNRNKSALAFINIFHNIFLQQYIALLEKYQPNINLTDNNLKQLMQSILGSQNNDSLITDTKLFLNQCVSAEALQHYLSKQLNKEIEVLPLSQYSHKLGSGDNFSFSDSMKLGENTILGEMIRVDAAHFTVNVIVETDAECTTLYQNKNFQDKIKQLIHACLGYGYRFSVSYFVKAQQALSFDGNRLLGVNCLLN